VLLTARWHELVVPDDLVRFSGPDGATLVANPELASWAALSAGDDAVLQALADGVPVPALPAAAVERSLATLVLNWLVYLPGRRPAVREDPPTFQNLYYAITDGCNLRCPYCYASSTRRLPGELGTAESLDLVDQVTVSVDGGTAELHERTRGAGTFATTIAALRLLNAAGVEPITNHVVSEENVDHLPDLARTLAASGSGRCA
jgi:sulfatase maturation enzyme AslB (radical SAM superfamily)